MKDIIKIIIENYNSKTNPYYSVDLDYLKTSVMNATELEISNTNTELEKLRNDLEKFPSLYCNKYGHSYITINYRIFKRTWRHSFMGDEMIYDLIRKCTVCGANDYIEVSMYSFPDRYVYKKQLPDDIYDNQSLQINGKTYKMTEAEISRLEDYLAYLYELQSTICDLIDNTMERERQYRNLSCSKTMLWNDYINYIKKYPIIYNVETYLSFPTFEEYENNKRDSKNKVRSNNDSSKGFARKIKKRHI